MRVLVRGDPQALLLEVANGPAVVASPLQGDGTGNGLRGLKERADECGATIHAGPAEDGGWLLTARAPRHARALAI